MSCNNLKDFIINLSEGNASFMRNSMSVRERFCSEIQNPCVIVISCSDSRVSVPVIFNYPSVGIFFEIKTAGQVLSESDIESIKYAILNFNCLAILVLGHTKCGAVTSTVESLFNSEINNSFPVLISSISPSVYKVINNKNIHSKEDLINKSIFQNTIDKSLYLDSIFGNDIQIIAAIYDVSTGEVNFL